ncbi:TetR/AcrR family transcriptional regulator [Poseidonibacter lekithochrous]|uniref:TetR/AcrR family transcriptional regulator n=1 Tax=Poseidonibacter TaxID=2321187 RepID=UPI000C93801B|nr:MULTISPECIES: TetR/AcrR family transcriptional regulator [Poseidonibacter]MAD42892.1 TetR family transcriptional regulator [Arcobacter sp.]MBU3013945.1 TetR/AcrR family transcriptional regulator [Poseidonibacter lekithochrous]MDO6827240.1 TetR/AcrR family transcriptional regulator [Poseidonibacter sp. 1_MG-2023]|tara:strand:- start:14443 stop:15039 length:597 start_codon:yes stop_codon:yes gene_type:complete
MARITKEERKSIIVLSALKLFSQKGFYTTTIPDIAKNVGMSVGSFYNYFTSKDLLAKELVLFISEYLGKRIRKINEEDISTEEKISKIVSMYFDMVEEKPEMIEYFLRVYLSNREIFGEECKGMICVSSFVTEMMIFFDEGVECGKLHNQDFFSAFGLFMGYLGGMAFLHGEEILPESLNEYKKNISENIFNALKSRN